jgi:hypothetical protein
MNFYDINFLYELDKHFEKTCNKVNLKISLKETESRTKIHIEVLKLINEKIKARLMIIEKLIEKPEEENENKSKK